MNLKQRIVVENPDGVFEIWTREEYNEYVHHCMGAGGAPAYGLVTHFNDNERLLTSEELKEGGGMKTKEEILEAKPSYSRMGLMGDRTPEYITLSAAAEAMDEYAAQFDLRGIIEQKDNEIASLKEQVKELRETLRDLQKELSGK